MQKRILALSASALLAAGASFAETAQLHLFTWMDYVDPELVKQFEEENDCKVVIDIFDSNEAMLAKLQAGATGYDLLFPSSYMVAKLARDGYLEKLDHSRIPNLANIDPAYVKCALDPEMTWSIPYMVTYTGIAYRTDRVTPPPTNSWAVFETRPDLVGKTTLLNDMRETLGAALRYHGHSINTTNEAELAEARDTVIRWKKGIAKFENEQYKTGVASGEFWLVHGYSGDIGQVQAEEDGGDKVGFFLPEEGFSLSCDEMAIPANAPNKDLAYAYINFMHDAKVAAQNMQYTVYWCPNAAAKALLEEEDPEFAANPTIFPSADDLARGEVIDDLGDALPLYTKVWGEVLAAEETESGSGKGLWILLAVVVIVGGVLFVKSRAKPV